MGVGVSLIKMQISGISSSAGRQQVWELNDKKAF